MRFLRAYLALTRPTLDPSKTRGEYTYERLVPKYMQQQAGIKRTGDIQAKDRKAAAGSQQGTSTDRNLEVGIHNNLNYLFADLSEQPTNFLGIIFPKRTYIPWTDQRKTDIANEAGLTVEEVEALHKRFVLASSLLDVPASAPEVIKQCHYHFVFDNLRGDLEKSENSWDDAARQEIAEKFLISEKDADALHERFKKAAIAVGHKSTSVPAGEVEPRVEADEPSAPAPPGTGGVEPVAKSSGADDRASKKLPLNQLLAPLLKWKLLKHRQPVAA